MSEAAVETPAEAPAQAKATTVEPPAQPEAKSEPPAKPEPDWKAEARKWENRAKANADKVSEYDRLVEASKSDHERAVEDARREGQTEANKKANGRLVAAETRALAAVARFRDPMDALAQLRDSLDGIPVDDDGNVDSEAIQSALSELATRKPYLLAEEGATTPAVPRPDPSQGPRGPATNDDALYQQYFPPASRG